MAQELPSRVANLEKELIFALKVDVKHALVPFQERERTIKLQVEIKRANNLLFKDDQVLSSDLFAQKRRKSFDHHVEAWVHVLVHFCGHQQRDSCQLDQIGGFLSLGGENSEISVGDAHCEIEGVFCIVFDSMKLLNQRNH